MMISSNFMRHFISLMSHFCWGFFSSAANWKIFLYSNFKWLIKLQNWGVLFVSHNQSELERIEDEQTLEELQILREIVHESFRKLEEIAEVRSWFISVPKGINCYVFAVSESNVSTFNKDTKCIRWYSKSLFSNHSFWASVKCWNNSVHQQSITVNISYFLFPVSCFQCLREPISEPAASSPPGTIPRSGSSGMIQYLQSWFPGWGGWYGGAERGPDGQPVTDELMPGSSQWDILGELRCIYMEYKNDKNIEF